jgi:phosphatidylglycerol:prolipoprotein diacylglycerol transferase
MLFFLVKKLKKGQTASLYLVLYGTTRYIMELFRGDHKDFIFNLFTPAQLLGLLIVPAGIMAFVFFSQNDKKNKI